MRAVPPEIARHDEVRLVRQNMVTGQRMHDYQWLRYYLDFCGKYSFAPTARQSLPAFQDLGFLLGMDGPPREPPLPSAPLFLVSAWSKPRTSGRTEVSTVRVPWRKRPPMRWPQFGNRRPIPARNPTPASATRVF